MSDVQRGLMPRPWEQRAAEPPSIERQMLLAQFACAALTGFLLHPSNGAYSGSETVRASFACADEMLAEFYKRVPR